MRKIAFLNLPDRRKSEISKRIIRDSNGGRLYFLVLFSSIAIATFGLLTNSTAVVIGAMLVSPLLRPIQGLAFAISTGNGTLFFRSFRLLFLSFLTSVVGSFALVRLVPFADLTTEILMRTNPTLIDIFIAIFAGLVGMISFGYPRITDTVAGVAIASSLIPPLSVIGIGLFFSKLDVAWGSFLLFSANLISIILVGTLVFIFFGFWPNNERNKRNAIANISMIILVSGLILFPLVGAMVKINENYHLRVKVEEILETDFEQIDKNIIIKEFSIFQNKGSYSIFVELSTTRSVNINQEDKEEILRKLEKEAGEKVYLEIKYTERVEL